MRLHVNIDHVATVRNARGTDYPDPCRAALLAVEAGADGITAHLREDRRHIRDADMRSLRDRLAGVLNMEMAATPEMLDIAQSVAPNVITLVPERREERTTEGGLDVMRGRGAIENTAAMCARRSIKLSLFIEPDEQHVRLGRELGAQQVEFHTGEFALAKGTAQERELERIRDMARLAESLGLEVAAGHGLTQGNLPSIAGIAQVAEVNIGHAIIADALFFGIPATLRAFRAAIATGRG